RTNRGWAWWPSRVVSVALADLVRADELPLPLRSYDVIPDLHHPDHRGVDDPALVCGRLRDVGLVHDPQRVRSVGGVGQGAVVDEHNGRAARIEVLQRGDVRGQAPRTVGKHRV